MLKSDELEKSTASRSDCASVRMHARTDGRTDREHIADAAHWMGDGGVKS